MSRTFRIVATCLVVLCTFAAEGAASSGVRIIAQEGSEVILAGQAAKGEVRAIATMVKEGDTLYLRGAHVEGAGTWREIKAMVQQLGREQGVTKVVIEGGKRTTGAAPGHVPAPITIKVPGQ